MRARPFSNASRYTYLGVWRYLPDAGTFSVREWMQDETRTGCLPLQKNVTLQINVTQFDAYNTAYMRGGVFKYT